MELHGTAMHGTVLHGTAMHGTGNARYPPVPCRCRASSVLKSTPMSLLLL